MAKYTVKSGANIFAELKVTPFEIRKLPIIYFNVKRYRNHRRNKNANETTLEQIQKIHFSKMDFYCAGNKIASSEFIQ